MKRTRKRLPKKYLFEVFRPLLLGVKDIGEGPVLLKLITISEESENFRKTAVPRAKLKKYLDREIVRIPEGKAEELAGVLLMEKLESEVGHGS